MEKELKWESKIDTFSQQERFWNGVYLQTCDVLNDVIEVNLYIPTDADNDTCEIYVNYGKLYGVSYVEGPKAYSLKDEIKKVIYDDFMAHPKYQNSDSQQYPTAEFINSFAEKYHLSLSNAFFDEDALMENLINLMEEFD